MTATVNWHKDWYREAIAALSEGFCPEHGTALRSSGWCPACAVWWSISHEDDPVTGSPSVVVTYPRPWMDLFPEP